VQFGQALAAPDVISKWTALRAGLAMKEIGEIFAMAVKHYDP
jgi:hypothetical protein